MTHWWEQQSLVNSSLPEIPAASVEVTTLRRLSRKSTEETMATYWSLADESFEWDKNVNKIILSRRQLQGWQRFMIFMLVS
jgi:hypothetical protein